MKYRMMRLLPLLWILCFWTTNLDVVNAAIDCSMYSNDLDIINHNPFFVRLSLTERQTSTDYNSPQKIVTQMIIANDKNPSNSIFCLKNLQILQLINTNLSQLTEMVSWKNLQLLRIETDNGVISDDFPSEIGELTSLKTLQLIDIPNLKNIPTVIGQLTSLETLTLTQMPNLVSIPTTALSQLTKLMVLNLIDLPEIPNMPYPMENLSSLKSFSLINTKISDLQLQNLKSLQTLTVASHGRLSSIQLSNMSSLSSLNISDNPVLEQVTLQNLSISQTMSFRENRMLTLISMENIGRLSAFSIYNSNALQTINMKQLSSLTLLTLSSNAILTTAYIYNAPSLTTVTITDNPYFSNIVLTDCNQITQLDLSGGLLTSFPETILGLKSLRTLNIRKNALSSLPRTISTDLPNLQILDLTGNRFKGNLFQPPLIYVRELYLNNNSFTALDGIGGYQSINKISLDFNQIESIPSEIINLSPVLKTMSLVSNPLISIPYLMTNMRALNFLLAMNNQISQEEKSYLIQLFRPTSISINLF